MVKEFETKLKLFANQNTERSNFINFENCRQFKDENKLLGISKKSLR